MENERVTNSNGDVVFDSIVKNKVMYLNISKLNSNRIFVVSKFEVMKVPAKYVSKSDVEFKNRVFITNDLIRLYLGLVDDIKCLETVSIPGENTHLERLMNKFVKDGINWDEAFKNGFDRKLEEYYKNASEEYIEKKIKEQQEKLDVYKHILSKHKELKEKN